MKYKRKSDYKQGFYRPKNWEKFGEVQCIYRSSWERDFLIWCDYNDKVIKIQYEKIVIPYICKTDGKLHKYYIDCKLLLKEKSEIKIYLIEIKPFRQTIPPKPSNRKKKTTILTENYNWIKNNSKWEYAKEYCKIKGYRWCIMTEKGMYIDDKFFNLKIFGINDNNRNN